MLNKKKKAVLGKIHSFESFGAVDGPGVRYVVFTQGCPLRCLYCHNPDTLDPAAACHNMTAPEVFRQIERFKSYHKKGGVTISGGEPFLQPEFVKEIFRLCKDAAIHTAVDTSGFFLNDRVKTALEYTDLVLLDLKCMDPAIHKKLTRQELEPTLIFAKYIAQKKIPAWIRYVLVPGWTDRDDLIHQHARFVSELKNVEKAEILPFHDMAKAKYENLGLEWQLAGVEPPGRERVENAKKIYKRYGIEAS